MPQYISVYITYLMRFSAEAAFCISSLSLATFLPNADIGAIGDKNPALFTCFLELASATLDKLFHRDCTLTVADTIACGSRGTALCQFRLHPTIARAAQSWTEDSTFSDPSRRHRQRTRPR
jgi:hypothetical protein